MQKFENSVGFRYPHKGMYVVSYKNEDMHTHKHIFDCGDDALDTSLYLAQKHAERLQEEGFFPQIYRAGAARPPLARNELGWNPSTIKLPTKISYEVDTHGTIVTGSVEYEALQEARELGNIERYSSNDS